MRVGKPIVEQTSFGLRLRAKLSAESAPPTPVDFWIEVPAAYADWLEVGGNAFVPFLTSAAGMRGERLHVEAPVCPRLAQGAAENSRRFHDWWPDFSAVTITSSQSDVEPRSASNKSILFFTRGVDSTYSALRAAQSAASGDSLHLATFSNIIRHWSAGTERRVVAATRRAADHLGFPLIELRTNALEFYPGPTRWFRMHGSLLASAALALGGRCRRACVPSSHDLVLTEGFPWGSRRDVEPLWSTQWTAIEQVGWDRTRVEKIQELSHRPEFLRGLKVCQKEDTDSNCGRCWKCVRTLCGFYVAGVEPPTGVFDRPLTPEGLSDRWNRVKDYLPDSPAKRELAATVRSVRVRNWLPRRFQALWRRKTG